MKVVKYDKEVLIACSLSLSYSKSLLPTEVLKLLIKLQMGTVNIMREVTYM